MGDITVHFAGKAFVSFGRFLTGLLFLTSPVWAGLTFSVIHPVLGAVVMSYLFGAVVLSLARWMDRRERGEM